MLTEAKKVNIDILYFGVEGFLLDLKTGEAKEFSTKATVTSTADTFDLFG